MFAVLALILLSTVMWAQTTLLTEGFEGGALPTGWSQNFVVGAVPWTYGAGSTSGTPAAAHTGSMNANLYYPGYSYRTELITPAIDFTGFLSGTVSFWQERADWAGDQDSLTVLYRTSVTGEWRLLGVYQNNLLTWTQSRMPIPNVSATTQICFRGCANYGYGVCLDDVLVQGYSTASSTLTGQVTSLATGIAIAGATVSIGSSNVTTNVTGNYTFPNMPTGIYRVTASATGFIAQTKSDTVFPGQPSTLNFSLVSSANYGTIQGQVFSNTNGHFIPTAVVSVNSIVYTVDSTGHFSIPYVVPGVTNVTASALSYISQTKSVQVTANQVAYVEFMLDTTAATGTVTGTISNSISGDPIPGATITTSTGWFATTDGSGHYTIQYIPIGTYEVFASATGYLSQTKTVTVVTNQNVVLNFALNQILPYAYNVTGSGVYCSVGPGLPVGLNGSQAGVVYTLYKDGIPQTPTFVGTGYSVSFGDQAGNHTYTVTGTNSAGTSTMNGSAIITAITCIWPVNYTIENDAQVSPTEMQFDLYLRAVDPNTPFELSLVQGGIFFNSSIIGGGTITTGVVPGSSQFVNAPESTTSMSYSSSQFIYKIACPPEQPCGPGGTILSTTGLGTRFGRFRIINSIPFVTNSQAGLSFSFTVPPYESDVYQWDTATPCQSHKVRTDSTNCFRGPTYQNIHLNPMVPPVAFNVTGGGSYCFGGTGLPVGLDGSQIGITYTLYQDTVAQVPTIPGTGSALDFGNQAGTHKYTVRATNSAGTTTMNGNAMITMNVCTWPIEYTIENDFQVSPTEMQFDLYVKNIDPSQPFELSSIQAGILASNSITGGGTVRCDVVPGYSNLVPVEQPDTAWHLPYTADQFVIKMPSMAPPGCGNGTVIGTTGSGTRVARLKIVNSVPFVPNSQANLSFWLMPTPPLTQAYQYVGSPCIILQAPTDTMNCYPGTSYRNIHLNVPVLPTAYHVTGGGSYCAGGDGLPVGLNGSQVGVTYTLYQDSTATVPVIAGTGSALDFGIRPGSHTYYVTGSNVAGTTLMTGSAVIIEMACEWPIVLTMEHDVQVSPTEMQFDLYLKNPDSTHQFELGIIQGGIYISTSIIGNGSITCDVVPGYSDLVNQNTPVTVASFPFSPNQFILKMAPNAPPYCGNGSIISTTGLGSRVTRLTVKNTVPFVSNSHANLAFSFTFPPYPTKIFQNFGWPCHARQVPADASNCYTGSTYLNIALNPDLLPLVYNVTGTGSYCAGSPGLPVGLDGSQAGVTYTLYKDGAGQAPAIAGTGSAITFGNQAGDHTYTVKGTGPGGSSDMSGDAVITVLPCSKTWSGLVSNDWNVTGNWIENAVPLETDDVIIPAGCPVFPVLAAGTITKCRNLDISGSAEIAQHGALTIDGDLTITGNLLVRSQGSLITNGAVTGTANIERTIEGNHAKHFLSSPVGSQDICNGIFAPVVAVFPGDSTTWNFSKWIPYCSSPTSDAGDWKSLRTPAGAINTADFGTNPQFVISQGYLVDYGETLPTTKTFTGTPNTGDKVCLFSDIINDCSWAMAGNPFPSAIDWTLVTGKETNLQSQYYYVYNEMKAGGAGYEYWKDAEHFSSTSVNGHIPSMQGFMVSANPTGNAGIGLPNTARLHDTTTASWLKNVETNKLKITLANGSLFDETFVKFENTGNAGLDNNDAVKLFSLNPAVPQVFSIVDNVHKVSFNSYQYFSGGTTIPVGIRVPVSGPYTLTIDGVEHFTAVTGISLEDKLLNNSQDLLQNPVYSFSAAGNEDDTRFLLHIEGTIGINENANSSFTVYSKEKTIYINSTCGFRNAMVTVSTILGQEISNCTFNDPLLKQASLKVDVVSGYYLVKIMSDRMVRIAKVYIN